VPIGSALLRLEREGYERLEFYVDVREDGSNIPPVISLVAKTPAPVPVATPVAIPRATPAPVAATSTQDSVAISQLVSAYQRALENPDVSAFVALCAPQVDFFDEGVKSQEGVRKSRMGFMKLWSDYKVHNLRGITVKDVADANTKRVSFTYEYHALNRSKGGEGKGTVTDTLDVRQIDGRWVITRLRQSKG
jgi:hypothetical protein